MSIFSKIAEALGGPVSDFVGAIFGGIDALSTTEEEKLTLKATIQAQQNQLIIKLAEVESGIIAEQASIIRAEIGSESWLTRSWRPITMLAFLGLLFMYWVGVQPENLTQDTLNHVFDLLKIGIGGYVISRGAEKGIKIWKTPNGDK